MSVNYTAWLSIAISGVMVISSMNTVHSVLWLVLTFIGGVVMFICMGADYIGIIFLVVYVGAIAILFLFVVMMLYLDTAEITSEVSNYIVAGLFIGGTLYITACTYLVTQGGVYPYNDGSAHVRGSWDLIEGRDNIHILGDVMYTEYAHLVIFISWLLLVAMVGVIILTFDHVGTDQGWFMNGHSCTNLPARNTSGCAIYIFTGSSPVRLFSTSASLGGRKKRGPNPIILYSEGFIDIANTNNADRQEVIHKVLYDQLDFRVIDCRGVLTNRFNVEHLLYAGVITFGIIVPLARQGGGMNTGYDQDRSFYVDQSISLGRRYRAILIHHIDKDTNTQRLFINGNANSNLQVSLQRAAVKMVLIAIHTDANIIPYALNSMSATIKWPEYHLTRLSDNNLIEKVVKGYIPIDQAKWATDLPCECTLEDWDELVRLTVLFLRDKNRGGPKAQSTGIRIGTFREYTILLLQWQLHVHNYILLLNNSDSKHVILWKNMLDPRMPLWLREIIVRGMLVSIHVNPDILADIFGNRVRMVNRHL